jgi:hypothetical protein|tara:strand:+ start:742 stop:948 length:207 start_codon:yes stop_codon:yes gene_type:complete
MKNIKLLFAVVPCILLGVSCSSTNLKGDLPIPFTNPASNLQGSIVVEPMPDFKAGVGVEVIPRPAPKS